MADKKPLPGLHLLKEGNMVTQDYRKPTERALTVSKIEKDQNRTVVTFTASNGDVLHITERTLKHYDIKVHVGTPMAGG